MIGMANIIIRIDINPNGRHGFLLSFRRPQYLLLARWVEHALDVPIERSQHAGARMYKKVAAFCGADQALDCGPPFLEGRTEMPIV